MCGLTVRRITVEAKVGLILLGVTAPAILIITITMMMMTMVMALVAVVIIQHGWT
jgi:hypothetical protein